MAVLPEPTFPLVDGEIPGARIWRIATSYAGCVPLGDKQVRRKDLAALVGRGVDDELLVEVKTNCGMFGLGVLAAAGVEHPLLAKKYVSGMAVAWIDQIGIDKGAWRDPSKDGPAPVGALLWYEIAGENDDHIEVCGPADDEHCGAGRPLNAVTRAVGHVDLSCGRPIHRWLDPESLGIPTRLGDPSPDPHQSADIQITA